MTTAKPVQFQKVFRFSVSLFNRAGEEKSLGVHDARWEGPHLIFTRAMTDGVVLGPILMGSAVPAHVLTPAATVRRVFNMTALAVASAATRHTG